MSARLSVRCVAAATLAVLCSQVFCATTSPLTIDIAPGANPWTHLNFRDDPDNFHFAILGDRNGGQRPEIFRDGLRKVNLLQPEFVINVGDLIPGYNNKPDEISAMWDEVVRDLQILQAPFFFTPGNHDLTNPVEIAEWHKRFGRTYYHFVYRNVLFLVLDSEVPPGKRLSAEQIDYFRSVIEKNNGARWTLVFLHGPLWQSQYARQAREQNQDILWGKFEDLLKGRNYSVFAGHTHDYTLYERKGQKYYILPTTGGGSALRGARNYGETDLITWVTMTEKGPVLANLELKGIYDEAMRTEEEAFMVNTAMVRAVQPQSVVLAPGVKGPMRTKLIMQNSVNQPMHVRVTFDPKNKLRTTPAVIETTVPAMGHTTSSVTIKTDGLKDTAAASPIMFDWKAWYERPGKEPVEAQGRKVIGVETLHDCGRRATTPTIDGRLNDWKDLPEADATTAHLRGSRKLWAVRHDCSFQFATQYDSEYVYIAVQVTDDKITTDPKRPPWEQDGVEIRLDARPDPERSESEGGDENETSVFIAVNPPDKGEPAVFEREKLPPGTRVACMRTKHGYNVEAAIPAKYLDEMQKEQWKAFRLNVAVDDFDPPKLHLKDRLQMWWRPDWRTEQNYAGSGTFRRK